MIHAGSGVPLNILCIKVIQVNEVFVSMTFTSSSEDGKQSLWFRICHEHCERSVMRMDASRFALVYITGKAVVGTDI